MWLSSVFSVSTFILSGEEIFENYWFLFRNLEDRIFSLSSDLDQTALDKTINNIIKIFFVRD